MKEGIIMKYCQIVRYLFPAYVDELTSNESNQLIESHIQECESCRKLLNQMKKKVNVPKIEIPTEQVEFLKYNRFKEA
ncbi:zf-HC2 domain-containing protein [Bacillaceae bacterium Marseille-Q3522]|nr:zf-HC2 domain-containing protein [Bacillaceae bacterium Marseille-Q3522]